MRRTPLKRRGPWLSRGPKTITPSDARAKWCAPQFGFCAVCGARGRLERHHIVSKNKLRIEGRQDMLWDLRNSLLVGDPSTVCTCHHDHTFKLRHGSPWHIPPYVLPRESYEFAVEVLGEYGAALYWDRHYSLAEAI